MHLSSKSLDMGLLSEGQKGLEPLIARLASEAKSLLKLPENHVLQYSIFQNGRKITCPLKNLPDNFKGEIMFVQDKEIAIARKKKEAIAAKQRTNKALLKNDTSVLIIPFLDLN